MMHLTHKLIMGSGKSTTNGFIAKHLHNNGIAARASSNPTAPIAA